MLPTFHNAKAFTLIEVVSGLAVTVIIIGGIFGIAGSALDLATASNRLRTEEIRHHHLNQFLRSSLLRLPPKATVAMESPTSLTFLNSGGTFQWPGSGSRGDRVGLRYRNQAIELIQFLGDVEVTSLVLVDRVSEVTFEVFDRNHKTWIDQIPFHSPLRPALMRMHYRMDGDSSVRVEVFWIPRFFQSNFTQSRTSGDHDPES